MSGFPVQRVFEPSPAAPPTLMVVIDTEEEFDWAAPFSAASTSVANIALQTLAQDVFDAHGVVPTYVIDYPVASTQAAVSVLRAIADDGRCEIGAHLHPWVNPPAEGPIGAAASYASNLPPDLVRRKLAALTDLIADRFGTRPTVYKAGRYGVGPGTPAVLRELGYTVDVSVVPLTSFAGDGGPDFSTMPDGPFLAAEGLLALPLSVHYVGHLAPYGRRVFPRLHGPVARRLRVPGIAAKLGLLERMRLSPEGHSLQDMIRQTRSALAAGARHFMLTYHSSTLLPGSTRYTRTTSERDAFLDVLDRYCRFFLGLADARADTVSGVAAGLMPTLPAGHVGYTPAPSSASHAQRPARRE